MAAKIGDSHKEECNKCGDKIVWKTDSKHHRVAYVPDTEIKHKEVCLRTKRRV